MKYIAFHLPQYHTFPENDEFWGKGFTEWVNVKKALPLYKNHNQPRIPLDNNYYSMVELSTLEKQAEISRNYGVYGFCYYHYWFNGKLLMQKPLELLLANPQVDQKFCFSWANEPWTRSWDGKTGDVIVEQEYGDSSDWEKHFLYLLPFFKDERYIKIDGRPVFLIYRTESIPCLDSMIDCWNKLSEQNGLKPIYFVETLTYFQSRPVSHKTQAVVDFEPMYVLQYGRSIFSKVMDRIFSEAKDFFRSTKIRFYTYDSVWKKIINCKIDSCGKKLYRGAFVDWDNTPRRSQKGTVFEGATEKKFGKFLKSLGVAAENDFIFINAWNEWAEGAYLEPDEKNEFRYLMEVKKLTLL